MTVWLNTPLGRLTQLDGRHGPRWYVEMPCGDLELLDVEQLHGRLSVNHAAACRAQPNCGYHETHNFAAALTATEGEA